MSLFDSGYLSINAHDTLPVLVARWHRSVMPFELYQGYAALLNAATELQCRFWLLDIQRRTAVSGADVHWLLEQFYPQIQPRLGRTTYLAYLMAPHQLAGLLADAATPDQAYLREQPHRLHRFTEEADAMTWLEYHRQKEAAFPAPAAAPAKAAVKKPARRR